MTKDLVIFRAGARSLHPHWRDPTPDPSWDLYVCPYQPIPETAPTPGVTIGGVIPGPKFAGIRTLLNTWSGWRDYRYIMLADDDLLMSQATVAGFFMGCATLGAKLAQPALSEQSPSGHIMLLRNTAFRDRLVTFIEIMTPCFRSDVLKDLLWTLDLTETGWGWGLDALWPKLLDYKDLIIIDVTQAVHTRPVGQMRDLDLERRVQIETSGILKRFDCGFVRQTLAGHTLDGREIPQGSSELLYALVRGYDGLFQRQPELLQPLIEQQLNGYVADTDTPAWMRR